MPINDANKFDGGKLRLSLVPPELIEAVAKIREYGCKKYGDSDSWKKVEPQRYKDALYRHLLADARGEKTDAESGLPHIWHAACNIAFICALMGNERQEQEEKQEEQEENNPDGESDLKCYDTDFYINGAKIPFLIEIPNGYMESDKILNEKLNFKFYDGGDNSSYCAATASNFRESENHYMIELKTCFIEWDGKHRVNFQRLRSFNDKPMFVLECYGIKELNINYKR